MHKEFRLSGTGGQGVIMLGVILAEAAISSGLNALQSQSYGPEARGGASRCEVIIAEDEIDFPKVQHPDYVLCLSQAAADKYAKNLSAEAELILDSGINLSVDPGTKKIHRLPIISTARNVIGKEITANIISLGVLLEITKLVEKDVLIEAVLHRVPKGTETLNKNAIEAGIKLVHEQEK